MSLINDALKRASGAPAARPDLPSAVPVVGSHRTRGGAGQSVIIGLAVLGLIAVGILWFKTDSTKPLAAAAVLKRETNAAAAPSQPEKAAKALSNPIERAANTLNKVAARNDEGEQTADMIMAKTSVAAPPQEMTPPAAAPKTVEPSAPAFPELKLQAIYFRPGAPSAIVNGRTVNQGSAVAGVKILSITRKSVEVEFQGEKKALTLN